MNKFNNILIVLFVIILSIYVGYSVIFFVDKKCFIPQSEDTISILKINDKERKIYNKCKCKISNNINKKKVDKKKNIKELFPNNITSHIPYLGDKNNSIDNIITAEKYYKKKYNYPFLPFNETECINSNH